MPSEIIAKVLGAAVCAVLLVGCTTTSQGQPQPAPPSSSTTTTEPPSTVPQSSTTPSAGQLPSDGAPKVTSPLNASRYQKSPCQVLTLSQLKDLNLPAQGEQKPAPLGLSCEWMNEETRGDVEIQWGDNNPRGLSGTYAARHAGRYAFFIEYSDVEGFPAVAHGLSDTRDLGECSVTVGVTDQLDFQLSTGLSQANVGKKDPCEVAVQVAGMALKTMKGGA